MPSVSKRASPALVVTPTTSSVPIIASPGLNVNSRQTLEDNIHCVGMTYLYTTQGLVQAVSLLICLSFLHINKGFSLQSLGLLGLPSYAFSFKFVWAPIVDLLWARSFFKIGKNNGKPTSTSNLKRFAHRRLQWTVGVQLGMCLSLWYLYILSTSTTLSDGTNAAWVWELIATNQRSVWDVVIALFALTFLNATQDIAVDAWAVEGLPASKSSYAGTLQFVGLTVGMTLYSLFSNFYTSDSTAYPVSLYFYTVGIVAFLGVFVAVATALMAPLHSGEGSASDEAANFTSAGADTQAIGSATLKEIISFLKAPSIRAVIAYLLTRGFLESSNSLMGVELMGLEWTSTANTATLSLIATVVQLLSATVITPLLLKMCTPKGLSHADDSGIARASLDLMRRTIPLNASVHIFNYAFFVWAVLTDTKASPTTQWWYLWAIQAPQMVFLSVLRSTVFVCVCTIFAKEAARAPTLTGTVVTILNSIANMGYALPSSFVMLTSEWWMGWLLGKGDVGAQWALISGGVSMTIGALLLASVTVPSLKKLEAFAITKSSLKSS